MQIGTRFRVEVVPKGLSDVTRFKEYTICGIDEDGEPYFLDDRGLPNFAVGHEDGYLESREGMYTIL